MTKDWRDDFDWTDPDDVQLMRDMLPDPNGDQSNGLDTKELGPDNKEACKLMEAQQNLLPYEKKYEEPIVSEPGEFQQIEGVGKDIYGKYSYALFRDVYGNPANYADSCSNPLSIIYRYGC